MSRRLASAASAAALLLAAACGSSAPGEQAASSPGATGASASPTATGSETAPPSPGNVTRLPTSGPSAAPLPGSATQEAPTPRVGLYTYASGVDIGTEQFAGERTLAHFPARARADGTVQIVRQTTKLGSAGEEKKWWFRTLWRPDGRYLLKEITPNSVCTLDRPLLELRLPLTTSTRWTSTATCAEDGWVFTIEGRVTDTETVRVDGRDYDTFVVQREVTKGPPGSEADPLLEKHWVSPEHLLSLRMFTRGSDESVPLEITDTLRSLEPDPLPDDAPPNGF